MTTVSDFDEVVSDDDTESGLRFVVEKNVTSLLSITPVDHDEVAKHARIVDAMLSPAEQACLPGILAESDTPLDERYSLEWLAGLVPERAYDPELAYDKALLERWRLIIWLAYDILNKLPAEQAGSADADAGVLVDQ